MSHSKAVDENFAFYKIAFQWYPIIGVISMVIPAIIVSFLTGGQDLTNFNVQLLSPCVQKLLPEKYRHTELKTMQTESKETDALKTTKWIFKKDDREEYES